jgi:hypothetical protein
MCGGGQRVEPVSFVADMIGMESTIRGTLEPRKAMMAVAKVTWEDEAETVHTAPATIEDTSPSGACFRLKIPIRPGSRVEVSWCRDDFSGTTKWCREDQEEYLVGMQRDRIASKSLARIVPRAQAPSARPLDVPPPPRADIPTVREVERPVVREVEKAIVREVERPSERETRQEAPIEVQQMIVPAAPPPVPAMVQNIPPAQRQVIRRGTLAPIPKPKPLPLMRITFPLAVIQKPVIGFEIALDNTRDEPAIREERDPSAQYQKRTTSFFEERTEMSNKWLNLGSKGQQKIGANGGGGISAAHFSPGMAGDTTLAPPRGDLLLLEDIYRTAGIMEPRMGYSITKVVEMLSNDHLRGLGDEVKRASVLMALNAAGIPLGDILQDAAQRQAAVAAYEVEQRKKFEEYWTRRAEENTLLQSEMERVTRQYVERMNRNLTEVQQEKEAFQKWQTAMQHEVLRISEAVTLCAQPAVYESSSEQPATTTSQSLVAKSA